MYDIVQSIYVNAKFHDIWDVNRRCSPTMHLLDLGDNNNQDWDKCK